MSQKKWSIPLRFYIESIPEILFGESTHFTFNVLRRNIVKML